MTYLMTTHNVGGSLEGYRAITANLDTDTPPGLIARYAGATDAGLAITVVWESKAHADRFEAEHLLPTVRRLFGELGEPPETIAFEAQDEVVPAARA